MGGLLEFSKVRNVILQHRIKSRCLVNNLKVLSEDYYETATSRVRRLHSRFLIKMNS